MATYKCPECGHGVSKNAPECPECGEPDVGGKAVEHWRKVIQPIEQKQLEDFQRKEAEEKREEEEFRAKHAYQDQKINVMSKSGCVIGAVIGAILLMNISPNLTGAATIFFLVLGGIIGGFIGWAIGLMIGCI